MSTIHVARSHQLSQNELRQISEQMAEDLRQRFQLKWHWQDHVLHFERTGLQGTMHLLATQLIIEARLGWLLKPMKPMLEKAIAQELDQRLGGNA